MKRIIYIVIAVLLLSSLAACGGNSDDPNLGVWKAVTGEMFGISMEVEEFFEKGFTIELKANGKCALNVDGTKANGTWTLSGSVFTVKGGSLDCKGRLEDGQIILEDVLGMGMTLVFEKEGARRDISSGNSDAPTSSGKTGNPDKELSGGTGNPDKELSDKLAWWDGDWYGYWTIVSGSGRYESMKGGRWDCYMTINAYADNTATIFWYDDDMFLGEVEVELDFDGYQIDIGFATSVSGTLFDDPVQDGAWYISPDNSNYDNMIEIDKWHEDLQGVEFRYKVFLRPWGMLWDDIPAGERPPDYDWYLGVRNSPMDDALGGSGDSGSGTSGSASNTSGPIVESEVKSMSGKTGTMSVVLPEGWFDHSAPDLMSGFMHFSVSEDDAWADKCIQIRSSWLLTDTVEESLMYDGAPISISIDYTEWVGVEERDGLGYVEVVTNIDEDCYVSIYFQGMDTRDEVVGLILESFRMKWD